jgi:hypothetical protein
MVEIMRLGNKNLAEGEELLDKTGYYAVMNQKGETNGTELRNNAGNNSFLGKAQAGHFQDAKAIVGRVYSASPEDARSSQIRNEEGKQLKAFAA